MANMIIDEMQSTAQLRQFASQVSRLSPEEVTQFESMWSGNRSDEFYLGLIAGLAVATAMLQGERAPHIPRAAAFVADRLARKEIIGRRESKEV